MATPWGNVSKLSFSPCKGRLGRGLRWDVKNVRFCEKSFVPFFCPDRDRMLVENHHFDPSVVPLGTIYSLITHIIPTGFCCHGCPSFYQHFVPNGTFFERIHKKLTQHFLHPTLAVAPLQRFFDYLLCWCPKGQLLVSGFIFSIDIIVLTDKFFERIYKKIS